MENAIKNKKIIISAALSLVLWSLSFISDRGIFVFPQKTETGYTLALTDYCICRILALIVLFALIYAAAVLVFDRDDKRERLLDVLRCGLVYLPVIAIVLIIKIPAGFVTNDEYSILNDATHLIHDTWFNFMTVYYFIVSLMLIPVTFAPIIMKAVIEFFVVGYTVSRTKGYFGKKAGMFMYVLFLLYPVVAYTTSAHRLPVYFLLYLLLFVKLFFDRLEDRSITTGKLFLMLLAGAALTQWRTEGIYLLVLVPILLFIVYPHLRGKKQAALLIISYLAIQYIISIPQNGIGSDVSGAANDRMKPFYAYTITNMYRNGLDTGKNEADLAVIDRYIPIEAIESINEHYGDINYEDVLILMKEEFGGVRQEAGYTEYYDFTEAVKRIFKNNPDVFAKTRIGAFCYAALPYHMAFEGTGIKELAKSAISVIKTVTYNLFIPTGFAAVLCIYCLIKRKWYTFFVTGGLIAHWFIVFVLAPASYFKYYFPVYIMAYFYIIVLLIRYFSHDKRTVI